MHLHAMTTAWVVASTMLSSHCLQVHFAQHTCFKRLVAAFLGCRVMAGAGQLLDIRSELLL